MIYDLNTTRPDGQPISRVHNCDCMEFMRGVPDGFFELAIVDPPYGIGDTTTSAGNKKRKTKHKRVKWNKEIPDEDYFFHLERISKNQIIWGANYFYPFIKVPGRIIHYKDPKQNLDNNKIRFCAADIASQSFYKRIEVFKYNWYGNNQNGIPNFKNEGPDARIHPTQKPIALYKWILKKYAKPGNKIFDSHLGSQSSRLACWDAGLDFWGCELDKDYFEAGCKRFDNHIKQLKLL